MNKLFEEYGGVITTVIAIVALIGIVSLTIAGPNGGWVGNAFADVIDKLSGKALYGVGLPNDDELPDDVVPPELSEIAPMVFVNATDGQSDYGTRSDSSVYGTSAKYFYIPVSGGSTLNITNNSDIYKLCVIGVTEFQVNKGVAGRISSGWIEPGASKDHTLNADNKYIYLSVAHQDEKTTIDLNDVDLSDFVVTYENSDENLLDTLVALAVSYDNASLKNYDANRLLNYYNSSPKVAHGTGSADSNKNTLASLKNAVEVKGFEIVEFDVRATSDNVLVSYHDATLEGTSLAILDTTYEELKSAKSDLATVDELLEYCGENNIKVVLDVKNIGSEVDNVNNLFSLIEEHGLENNFQFGSYRSIALLYNNTPEKYKNVKYNYALASFPEGWFGNEQIVLSSRIGEVNPTRFIYLLNNTDNTFEFWDGYDYIYYQKEVRSKLFLFFYLADYYDSDTIIELSMFDNMPCPEISEKGIISQMPKDYWDSLGLINYN